MKKWNLAHWSPWHCDKGALYENQQAFVTRWTQPDMKATAHTSIQKIEWIHISAMWMMPCACLLRSKRWPLALVILRWTSFFGHILMHILPMKSSYQKSVKKRKTEVTYRPISNLGHRPKVRELFRRWSCWWKMRLRWKAAFRPVKVDTPVELVKPKTKMKESNATISESK